MLRLEVKKTGMVCARCLVKWETITRGNYTWSLFEAHALCCHHFIYISFLLRMVDNPCNSENSKQIMVK